jgi:hypothetical protein
MSWTADHVVPIAQALARGMTQPQALRGEIRGAHRACNTRKGDGPVKAPPTDRTTAAYAGDLRCTGFAATGEKMTSKYHDTATCRSAPHSSDW